MSAVAFHITNVSTAYSTVYSGADKRTSKLRVTGLCARNSPVNGESPHKGPVTRKNVSIWWRHHEMRRPGPCDVTMMSLSFLGLRTWPATLFSSGIISSSSVKMDQVTTEYLLNHTLKQTQLCWRDSIMWCDADRQRSTSWLDDDWR